MPCEGDPSEKSAAGEHTSSEEQHVLAPGEAQLESTPEEPATSVSGRIVLNIMLVILIGFAWLSSGGLGIAGASLITLASLAGIIGLSVTGRKAAEARAAMPKPEPEHANEPEPEVVESSTGPSEKVRVPKLARERSTGTTGDAQGRPDRSRLYQRLFIAVIAVGVYLNAIVGAPGYLIFLYTALIVAGALSYFAVTRLAGKGERGLVEGTKQHLTGKQTFVTVVIFTLVFVAIGVVVWFRA